MGEKCINEDDVHLDYTENSFQLTIQNYDDSGLERCLCFSKLYDCIESASLKKKKNRVILSLVKKKQVKIVAESDAAGGDDEVDVNDIDEDTDLDCAKKWPCIGAV